MGTCHAISVPSWAMPCSLPHRFACNGTPHQCRAWRQIVAHSALRRFSAVHCRPKAPWALLAAMATPMGLELEAFITRSQKYQSMDPKNNYYYPKDETPVSQTRPRGGGGAYTNPHEPTLSVALRSDVSATAPAAMLGSAPDW